MDDTDKPKENIDLAWHKCFYCSFEKTKSQQEFLRHLRERHCTKEGGSYVCRYGYNGVCTSLPMDGVSDRDYETHVYKHHISQRKSSLEQWSIYSAAQNLPAVLNDPKKGKQANFFTRTWGESFVEHADIPKSTYLPAIEAHHFEQYLRKTSKKINRRYKLIENIRNVQNDTRLMKNPRFIEQTETSTIPEIFTRGNLKLNDPHVFDRVFAETSATATKTSLNPFDDDSKISLNPFDEDNTILVNNRVGSRLLQEKLTHYLDIVEMKIAHQVSQKSSAFFHAMTSHDAIMEQMVHAISQVKLLREKINSIDKNLSRNSLKILNLTRSQTNHKRLNSKLKLMSIVLQTQPTLQLLLSAPDYVAALELIASTQQVLQTELPGVLSLRHLPSQLDEMVKLIDKMLNCEFEKYAAADLHRPLTDDEPKLSEVEKMTSLVAGLLRQKNLQFLEVYKKEAKMAAQTILKQLFIEYLENSDNASELCLTGSGEKGLAALETAQMLEILQASTNALSKLLHRIRAVHDIVKTTADANVIKIADEPSEHSENASSNLSAKDSNCREDCFLTREDYSAVEEKLQDLLKFVSEYYLKRCADIIEYTSQDYKSSDSKFPSPLTNHTIKQLVVLNQIVTAFSQTSEKLCLRTNPSFRSAFSTLADNFLQRFHSKSKSDLERLLKNERWRDVPIPERFQMFLDELVSGKISDESSNDSPTITAQNNNKDEKMATRNFLEIDNEKFVTVSAALMLLRRVHEYCVCAKQLTPIAAIIARKIVELLQSFNSQTSVLVLLGEATQTASLQTITTRNIALASRSLQLILRFVPYVKHFLRTCSVDIKSSFDACEKDILDHIEQLDAKIASIMECALRAHLNCWIAKPPAPSDSFRNISRDLSKLHENIADVLPVQQVNNIFMLIHNALKNCLRQRLWTMNLIDSGSPSQHGSVTTELTYYSKTVTNLKVLDVDQVALDSMQKYIWSK